MPLGREVGLGGGDIASDGDAVPTKRGTAPIFGSCLVANKTAGWIKMPLGTEVGLGPRDIVLDGAQLPLPPKRGMLPIFRPCLLWPNVHPSQLLLTSLVMFIRTSHLRDFGNSIIINAMQSAYTYYSRPGRLNVVIGRALCFILVIYYLFFFRALISQAEERRPVAPLR